MPVRLPARLARHLATACVVLLAALLPAAARADVPQDFQFTGPALSVEESAGQATVTVVRSAAAAAVGGQVRYITLGEPAGTAIDPDDFTSQKGELVFPSLADATAAGDPSAATAQTFTIPIVNHGYFGLDKTIQLSLFGSSPGGGLGPASKATLTIVNDDPLGGPVAGLPNAPAFRPTTTADPLAGQTFYVDHSNAPSLALAAYPELQYIAQEPGTARFGTFSYPEVGLAVNRYLTHAQLLEPGTLPMIATYRLVDGHCHNWTPTPSDVQSYQQFISRLSQGIGNYPAVLYLEMDSIITMPCLSAAGQRVREQELSSAIDTLTANNPHLIIYLDAGAADALPAAVTARLLNASGIAKIQGFFLNATHFDATANEIRYGTTISRLTGGKHFVINTGENGNGSQRAKGKPTKVGNSELCNPSSAGLGANPTASTGNRLVDAYAWTSNPGELGDGECAKHRSGSALWSPQMALQLIALGNPVRDPAFTRVWKRQHHHS